MNATIICFTLVPIFNFYSILNMITLKGFVVEWRELKSIFIVFIMFYLLVFYIISGCKNKMGFIKCDLSLSLFLSQQCNFDLVRIILPKINHNRNVTF